MAEADDLKTVTRDLQDVKVLVARISTMQENSEKRIDTLTDVTLDAVNGMNRLSERMTATVGMEKDIGAMRDTLSELKGDTRTLRHDMNNVANAIAGIAVVNEKLNEATSTIAAQGAKIEGIADRVSKIETTNANRDGKEAGFQGAAKTFWSFISTPFWMIVTAVSVWIMSQMYGGTEKVSVKKEVVGGG